MLAGRVPAILLEFGLPTKNRPKCGAWTSKRGVRIQGTHGVPYGADRLILLYLASEAVQQGHQVCGSLHVIMDRLGLDTPPHRLRARLLRIVGMWYERHHSKEMVCSRHHQIVERFAWRDADQTQYELTLTESFVESARAGAPCSMAIIRKLSRVADIDLYLWIEWQRHHGERRVIPAMGPHGPYGVLSSAVNRYKCRQLIRDRLQRIRRVWPGCPYRLSQDRTRFIHESRHARPSVQAVSLAQAGSSTIASTEPARSGTTPTTETHSPVARPAKRSRGRARLVVSIRSQAQPAARESTNNTTTTRPASPPARGSPLPQRRHVRKRKRRQQRVSRRRNR